MEAAVDIPSFVAIDFETANASPSSVVAIGLVRVDHGEVVAEVSERVRPWTTRFTFTHIHGLGPNDVADAPGFADVWQSVGRLVSHASFLAAHNAKFDREVLWASCERAGLPVPRLPFVCTMALARTVWQIAPATLPGVCNFLGLKLRHHHEPLADARACAGIVLAAWNTQAGRKRIARVARNARR